MPLDITLSDQARVNLLEIHAYISRDDHDAAKRVVRKIWDTIVFLSENPVAGRSREDLSPDLRSYPVGNYLVLFRIDRTEIKVSRVVHGARDLDALFESDSIDTFRMSEDNPPN